MSSRRGIFMKVSFFRRGEEGGSWVGDLTGLDFCRTLFRIKVFCKRYNKPFILPESGAAYYLNYYNHYNTTTGDYEDYIAAPGPGELRLKRTWWNHAWNAANTVRWPLLKAIVNFEESKIDERVGFLFGGKASRG